MNTVNLLVLEGDGIGPEVTKEAVAVLRAAGQAGGFAISLEHAPFGGASIDDSGEPVTAATLKMAEQADAVLLGAVGGPKWDSVPSAKRPERGLLRLRQTLGVFANLRPAKLFRALEAASPLKQRQAEAVDFIVVRELISGIYFGEPRGISGEKGSRRGVNTMAYTEDEIRRVGRVAFELARLRKREVVSVDKANVLEVQALWREVITELAKDFADVKLSHLYVDNCAMQLILDPSKFDVVVTSNLFGDILSDEAGALTGSIGMLPSASLGERHALYEPVHGSAPDIAGTGKANPLAAILSVGMLLEHTLRKPQLAKAVEAAVERVLDAGLRTADLMDRQTASRPANTQEMGAAVLREFEKLATAAS